AMLEPSPSHHGTRAIDLGCGTGELTAELHRYLNAEKTLGIDTSAQMLEKAQAFAGQGLEFKQGDLSRWREPSAYDVIFSNAAIQWSNDHAQIFKNLRDSLRNKGQLAIQMPMNHDYATHVLAREMAGESKWLEKTNGESYDKQSAMLSVDQYATLLYKLGFTEQKVDLRVYGHVLDTREGVIEWVKGSLLTYFETRMSPDDFASFLIEYRERLFKILPDEQPFFYPFKRILLWARA
ncbi:MAG: methyltransferase domain-containing protein, partial [Proteobacteria bacterium]